MDPKKLLPLALVLMALIGAAVWNRAQDKERQAGMQIAVQPAVKLGLETDPLAVHVIEITRPEKNEKIVLIKRPSGAWVLESQFGTKARKSSVEELLKQLDGVSGEVRSEDAAVLGDFNLKDEQAIHIRLTDREGKEKGKALLSSLRPRGTQNFIRRAGSNQVLLTTTDLLGTLGLYSDKDKLGYRLFADLRLIEMDSAKISALELNSPGSASLRLDRKENPKDKSVSWSLAQDAQAEVDPARVNEFSNSILNLYGRDAADPAARANDFTGTPWLKIYRQAGETPETIDISVGSADKDKKARFVRVGPDNLVYEFSDTALDNLLKRDKASFLKAKTA